MHSSKRLMWLVAAVALIALTAACGGQPAEETPAEQPAATEEPAAAAPEAAPEPEPEMTPEEPAAPAQPQLQGNIVEVGEGEFTWLNAATRETPGRYTWKVQLRNDTTQTLDITVTWQFLDENENTIKTDRETVRVEPAATGSFEGQGEMERDAARSVAFTSYSWDWKIVEGG
ncbi:MAG: hypothetical protein PVJ49_04945 [Acidobacteriota bacterium]|jgi:hypothetical protein